MGDIAAWSCPLQEDYAILSFLLVPFNQASALGFFPIQLGTLIWGPTIILSDNLLLISFFISFQIINHELYLREQEEFEPFSFDFENSIFSTAPFFLLYFLFM